MGRQGSENGRLNTRLYYWGACNQIQTLYNFLGFQGLHWLSSMYDLIACAAFRDLYNRDPDSGFDGGLRAENVRATSIRNA